jgi:tetratricopeptide (TPR) repeat protein
MDRSFGRVVALTLAGVLLIGAPVTGLAADSRESTSQPTRLEDPDYTAAMKAIDANNFVAAIPLLESVVSRDGSNADAYNSLAYAIRKNGDPARAIPIYQKALAIDPKHRAAHEYIGEAYLALNDVAKAREHLATLDRLCFLPCSQYRDLKKAIEAYQARGR